MKTFLSLIALAALIILSGCKDNQKRFELTYQQEGELLLLDTYTAEVWYLKKGKWESLGAPIFGLSPEERAAALKAEKDSIDLHREVLNKLEKQRQDSIADYEANMAESEAAHAQATADSIAAAEAKHE